MGTGRHFNWRTVYAVNGTSVNYLVSCQSSVEVTALQGFGADGRGWPRVQLLYPLKTTISPPIVLLSVSVPAELSQAIKAFREAEGLTICEWMLKDPRVRKWARTHAVPLPKPGKKRISRDAARWLDLTGEDWNRGIRHVANLLGVSRQAVAWKKSGSAPGKAMGSWNQVYPERRGGGRKNHPGHRAGKLNSKDGFLMSSSQSEPDQKVVERLAH